MHATKLFEAWAAAALKTETNAMADLYCEDGEHFSPFRDGAPAIKWREAIGAHMRGTLVEAQFEFDRLRSTVHDTEDPNTIIVECPFHVVKRPERTPFTPSCIELLTMREGGIATTWDYENLAYRGHTASQDA